MRTSMAMIVKFFLTFIFAFFVFTFLLDNRISWVLFLAIAVTVLNYIVGDLLVLSSMGNITASIGDGIMGVLAAYILDILVADFNTTFSGLLWFGILIAVGEYFFHIYLLKDEKVAP